MAVEVDCILGVDGAQGASGGRNRGVGPEVAILVVLCPLSERQSDETQSVAASPPSQGAH